MWFRQDLRLTDNPALKAACQQCEQLVAVFIDDPTDQTVSRLGAASRVWLHHSLAALRESLRQKGSDLFFVQGESLTVLTNLIELCAADSIFWNRCYDPVTIARDMQIKSSLAQYKPRTFNASLIQEPWENLKGDGSPYRVYTPFWRAAARQLDATPEIVVPESAPRRIPSADHNLNRKLQPGGRANCKQLDELALLPRLPWGDTMMSHWQVGEVSARKKLNQFRKRSVNDYDAARELPAVIGTSRLSPHLHFGEISPRQIVHRVLDGRTIGRAG